MPRRAVLAIVAALALGAPAPAFAQDPPSSFFQPAPAQDPGAATPTDGGRSVPLLALALVALAGAGVLAAMAVRAPARAILASEAGEVVVSPRHQPRLSAARAASAEASAAARLGMPVIPVEAPVEQACWRPRVASPPPLPAFGPGAGPPPPPPSPD